MTAKAVEPFAPKVQTNEGHKAVRGDCQREKQRRAERVEAPPKLECGTEDRKSYKQHGLST